jgi:hypothetical protein
MSVCCKGGADMKVGDVVGFRGRNYRVGLNGTDISIELVELKRESVGLWVSRDEVYEVPHQPQGQLEHSIDSVDFASVRSRWRLDRLFGRLQNR